MTTETSAIQPLTFKDLPWVAGIDTLSDLEWLESNPDGQPLLEMFDATPRAVVLLANPLRNLVKIMLEQSTISSTDCDDVEFGMLGTLEHLGEMSYSFETIEEIVLDAEVFFHTHYPGAPRTVEVFLAHLHADAEHWRVALRVEKANDIADAAARAAGRANH